MNSTSIDPELVFVVCSYNRGQFLQNCVDSIERNAPDARIIIADDLSEDPETIQILDQIEQRHEVLRPAKVSHNNPKVGGLYLNMQAALDHVTGNQLIAYIQDDMQLVRRLDAADMKSIRAHFLEREDAGFLCGVFLSGNRREHFADEIRWDQTRGCYFTTASGGWKGHFAAPIICLSSRMRAVNWRFAAREKLNDAQASEIFEPMGIMRDPFIMFLPAVPVLRWRRKTRALQIAEKRINAGFYPYNDLDYNKLEEFRKRENSVLPIAEDWLETRTFLSKPWPRGPLQDFPWLKRLNRLETAISRLIHRDQK